MTHLTCGGEFSTAHNFDYPNPGNIKFTLENDYYVANIQGNYYAIGSVCEDVPSQMILGLPITEHQVQIARQEGRPVYESVEDLNRAITANADNPVYGYASAALSGYVNDAIPSTPTFEFR